MNWIQRLVLKIYIYIYSIFNAFRFDVYLLKLLFLYSGLCPNLWERWHGGGFQRGDSCFEDNGLVLWMMRELQSRGGHWGLCFLCEGCIFLPKPALSCPCAEPCSPALFRAVSSVQLQGVFGWVLLWPHPAHSLGSSLPVQCGERGPFWGSNCFTKPIFLLICPSVPSAASYPQLLSILLLSWAHIAVHKRK